MFSFLFTKHVSLFTNTVATSKNAGHDKMRSSADLRGASPLVSCNHVIDPHFVAFSSSLYTTICNPKPNPNLNSNHDPNRNPIPNHTVMTDPQIGRSLRRDPQIVTVHIRSADPSRSAFCRVPKMHSFPKRNKWKVRQVNIRRGRK